MGQRLDIVFDIAFVRPYEGFQVVCIGDIQQRKSQNHIISRWWAIERETSTHVFKWITREVGMLPLDVEEELS